jgi:hypothetical protein
LANPRNFRDICGTADIGHLTVTGLPDRHKLGVLDCVAPHLSLLQDGNPGLRSEDRLVARAVALAARDGDTQASTGAVQIVAVASVAGGRFVRRVTARLIAAADGWPFRIVTWE